MHESEPKTLWMAEIPENLRKGPAVSFAIAEADEAFYLFTRNAEGCVLFDSWHQSEAEAMSQAEHDCGGNKIYWCRVDEEHGHPK